jgi:epoxide hydrolase 4
LRANLRLDRQEGNGQTGADPDAAAIPAACRATGGDTMGEKGAVMIESVRLTGQEFGLHRWGPDGAPPLVMLHGFPEHGGAWAGIAARLPGWRCLAPDQRGYGRSHAPPEVAAYDLRTLVADMAALIEGLGAAPVPVVAHDWGAVVGYGLAMWRPDLVSHLVVLNGAHPGPFQREAAAGGAQSAALAYIAWLRAEGSEDRLSANNFAKLRKLFAEGMDMSWLTGPTLDQYLAAWSRPGTVRGMVNWYRASPLRVALPGQPIANPHVLSPRAGHVPCPHLVIWGQGDRVLLPVCLDGLGDWCPDLTVHRVEGADHWICHQQPDLVAGLIGGWLRGRGAG